MRAARPLVEGLIWFALAGPVFWGIDVFHAAVFRTETSSGALLILSALMAAAIWLAAVYVGVRWRQSGLMPAGVAPFVGLISIWVFGGLYLAFAQNLRSGTFSLRDVNMTLVLWAPALTFMIATYDGTLGSLLVASVCLILLTFKFKDGEALAKQVRRQMAKGWGLSR